MPSLLIYVSRAIRQRWRGSQRRRSKSNVGVASAPLVREDSGFDESQKVVGANEKKPKVASGGAISGVRSKEDQAKDDIVLDLPQDSSLGLVHQDNSSTIINKRKKAGHRNSLSLYLPRSSLAPAKPDDPYPASSHRSPRHRHQRYRDHHTSRRASMASTSALSPPSSPSLTLRPALKTPLSSPPGTATRLSDLSLDHADGEPVSTKTGISMSRSNTNQLGYVTR